MSNMELKSENIYRLLKDRIVSGTYEPGYQFAPEIVLAKELGVGKVTLRSAFEKLENEGLLARIHGKGTFVRKADDKKAILAITHEFNFFANPSVHILDGIKEKASSDGIEVFIAERQFIESLSGTELAAFCRTKNIFGIIPLMALFLGDEKILEILKESSLPVILPHANLNDGKVTGFATIVVREEKGWCSAIEYLCSCGHSRIAAVIHEKAPSIRGYSLDGHNDLLRKNGADAEESLTRFIPYLKKDVEQAVFSLLNMEKPPTCILCYSDYFAIHVYDSLKENGLRIPANIAVMGTCGYPGAIFMNPSLSTVDYQYKELGAKALEILKISGEWFGPGAVYAAPQIFTDPVLTIRESTKARRVERVIQYA